MRMRMGQLRHLIREVAKTAADASKDIGLALAVVNDGKERIYILYSSAAIIQAFESKKWERASATRAEKELEKELSKYKPSARKNIPYATGEERSKWLERRQQQIISDLANNEWVWSSISSANEGKSIILGQIRVIKSKKSAPQWGASTVVSAAAEKGWGPFLYDIVMYMEGGLTPDRGDVSPAAQSVWRRYKDGRSDVEAKPLDNAKKPRTKTKEDDSSHLHDDTAPEGEVPQSPLNYAYFLSSPPDVAELQANHKKAEPYLEKYDIDLGEIATTYFRTRFHT